MAGKKGCSGRPTKFDPKTFPAIAREFCKTGATDLQLAEHLGVEKSTISDWKKKYPFFALSIQAGKDEVDAKVKEALLKRALGYVQKEERLIVVSQGQQMGSEVERHEVDVRYAGSERAQELWLRNRCPAEFRNTQHTELTGANGGPVKIEGAGVSGLLALASAAEEINPEDNE